MKIKVTKEGIEFWRKKINGYSVWILFYNPITHLKNYIWKQIIEAFETYDRD